LEWREENFGGETETEICKNGNFFFRKDKGQLCYVLYQNQSVQLYKLRSSIKGNKNGSQIKTANGCKDSWCLKVQDSTTFDCLTTSPNYRITKYWRYLQEIVNAMITKKKPTNYSMDKDPLHFIVGI
jgi:hypothetical protein